VWAGGSGQHTHIGKGLHDLQFGALISLYAWLGSDHTEVDRIFWCLRHSNAGDHDLHVILLGVGGVLYSPHTLVPLKSLDLDSQRVKKLALKLHAHSVHNAHKLVQTRCSLEHSPHLQTNQERSAGLSARNPSDSYWLLPSFLVKGLFFPSGPFSLIDVRSFLAACKFFSYFVQAFVKSLAWVYFLCLGLRVLWSYQWVLLCWWLLLSPNPQSMRTQCCKRRAQKRHWYVDAKSFEAIAISVG